MPETFNRDPTRRELPLWEGILDRVHTRLASASPAESTADSSVATAVARAHTHLVVALNTRTSAADDAIPQLVTGAVSLLHGTLALSGATAEDARQLARELGKAVRRVLGAHERAVLCGEITYGVSSEDADNAAARMRELLAALPCETPVSRGDLLPLRLAAVELAALLVRAAGNAATGGRADEAPEPRSPQLDRALRAIELDLARDAQAVEKPAGGDIAAHHLAAALRVQVSEQTHQVLASTGNGRGHGPTLRTTRQAWLALATHEYVAVTALDSELEMPTYRERFGTLAETLVEGAANVLCGARLATRPDAFRHASAWRHHAVALSYALEAHVAGLRGDTPSFAQAQLIVLTRLIRAVAAVAIVDLQRTARLAHDQRAPGRNPDHRRRSDA